MPKQTEMGKAFEYACLKALYEALTYNQDVIIENASSVNIARKFYQNMNDDDAQKMDLAAQAAVRVIVRLEPQLGNPQNNVPLYLNIQGDARGKAGDVRDVLCIRRQNEWEIGFSCKRNHFAVKHSRLSNIIDFGEQWFSKPCSAQYFSDIAPIFIELKSLKAAHELWRNIDDKAQRFYVPLLDAFIDELRRLDASFPGEIPPALIKYLLGRNDFYKVIEKDSNRTTEIQVFNLSGSLNRSAGGVHPQTRISQIRLPNRIFDISYKQNSDNTVIITCDNGWAISLRIHNASSKVEASLKFDVNLVGTPNLGSFIEPW